ncbi:MULTISPECIES: M23 family metallopeptidase [unclassified Campylobacter]|uniref:M23 family metallopeptidase n=1 Tax=unclassified Campylobacter TaxID=2593542 RepID=UPI003D331C80
MNKFILLVLAFLCLNANDITNGDVEIYATSSPKNLTIDGAQKRWISAKNSDLKFAIVAANYHKRGEIVLKNGDESVVYNVVLGDYKKEQISVNSKKVNPPKKVQKRINDEREEANKIYNTQNLGLKISQKFILPLNSPITSHFGSARVFNKMLKSYHGGTDFRAAVGVEVAASNDGVVVIAKDRYYAGGSVVIDHGEGIYTQYYHLSKISVELGQEIKRGEILGLSGASGRVSGPHLHFGVIADGVQVNPLNFIEKINKFLN